MAFPTSPTNGQQANINGITYTYSSAATAWTVSTSVSNTFVSINVSANVNSGNVLATGVISATGNVSGGNLVVTGNIIDTGALTIVTGSNGNITLSPNGTGIVAATGAISTTGNISANNATFTSNQTLSYGTANGVAYLNGSKVLTTGSALTFDTSRLVVTANNGTTIGSSFQQTLSSGVSAQRAELKLTDAVNASALISFLPAVTSTSSVLTIRSAGSAVIESAAGASALTLNTNGVLALQGASTSATGIGITFPATQSASADANTLDDYEEGTWTPSLTGSTSGSATSGGNTYGNYTKVGRLVTLNFVITISAVNTLVGNVKLSGIPFNLAAGGSTFENRYPQGATIFASLGTSWASIIIGSDGGTTTLAFTGTKTPATGTTNVTAADLTATSFFAGSIQYIA